MRSTYFLLSLEIPACFRLCRIGALSYPSGQWNRAFCLRLLGSGNTLCPALPHEKKLSNVQAMLTVVQTGQSLLIVAG